MLESLSLLKAAATNPAATVGPSAVAASAGVATVVKALSGAVVDSDAIPTDGRQMDWTSAGDRAAFALAIIVLGIVYVAIRRYSMKLGISHGLHSPVIDVYEPIPLLSAAFKLPRFTIDDRGRYHRLVQGSGSTLFGFELPSSRYNPERFGPGFSEEQIRMSALAKNRASSPEGAASDANATTVPKERIVRKAARSNSLRRHIYKKPGDIDSLLAAAASESAIQRKRARLASPTSPPPALILLSPTHRNAEAAKEKKRPVSLGHLKMRSPTHASFSSALSPLGSGIRLRSPMLLTLEEGTRGMSDRQVFTPTSLSHSYYGNRIKSPKSPRSSKGSPLSPRSPAKGSASFDAESAMLKSPLAKKSHFPSRDEGFDSFDFAGLDKHGSENVNPFAT